MKHPTASADLAGSATHDYSGILNIPRSRDAAAWVRTTADIAWDFCERAAAGEHLTYAKVSQAFQRSSLEKRVNAAVKMAINDAPEEGNSKAWVDGIVFRIAPGWHWVSGPDHTEEGFHIALTKFEPATDADPRKPWTEPTVTELPKPRFARQGLCETTLTERFDSPCHCSTYAGNLGPCATFLAGENGRCCFCDHADICHIAMRKKPVTLTIAGVELPNPGAHGVADDLQSLVADARSLERNHGMRFMREPECVRIDAAIAEIQRQAAEITELQDLLDEAIGPVRLVSEIANMSDVECSTLRRFSLREYARGKLNGDYTLPRLYGDEDRKRAVAELWPALGMTERRLENIVDIVAAALGLGRAL